MPGLVVALATGPGPVAKAGAGLPCAGNARAVRPHRFRREDTVSALVALGSTGLRVGLALISWALYLLAVALRNSL